MIKEEKEQPQDNSHEEYFMVTKDALATCHEYNIHFYGNIEEDKEYIKMINIFDTATENDIINLHVSSPGGELNLTQKIINSMDRCEAHIVGIADSMLASAATFIFLNCKEYHVNNLATMMIHNYSHGVYGKGQETSARTEWASKTFESLSDRYYKGFLTDDEISDLKKGSDFYFNSKEIADRLKKREQYLSNGKKNTSKTKKKKK